MLIIEFRRLDLPQRAHLAQEYRKTASGQNLSFSNPVTSPQIPSSICIFREMLRTIDVEGTGNLVFGDFVRSIAWAIMRCLNRRQAIDVPIIGERLVISEIRHFTSATPEIAQNPDLKMSIQQQIGLRAVRPGDDRCSTNPISRIDAAICLYLGSS